MDESSKWQTTQFSDLRVREQVFTNLGVVFQKLQKSVLHMSEIQKCSYLWEFSLRDMKTPRSCYLSSHKKGVEYV